MTGTVGVRRLTETDWRLFRTIRLGALADSLGSDDEPYLQESAFTAVQWRRRLRDHAQFAAFLGERAVGLVAAQPENHDTVYLYSLWLAPDARGRGLARLLVDAVVRWARSRSARTVRLRVNAGNVTALAIYESMGFEPADRNSSETPGPHGELPMTLNVR